VVDLAEGPRMMTEIVEWTEAAGEAPLRAGMELEAGFRDGMPVFRPRNRTLRAIH